MTDPTFPPSPFTVSTARACGVTRQQIEQALSEGRLIRPFRGVYVEPPLGASPLERARVARLVVSPFTVIRDRSAAWIWGVDCFDYSELDGTPDLETCVLRHHEPTDRHHIDSVVRDLLPEDWTSLGGVRVLTPLRTALDLGCTLPPHRALGAMDALMREHGFTRQEMQVVARRYRRRRGVVQLRRLLALVDPRAESQLESWLRWFIADRGLATPELQVEVRVEGRLFRLDLAYPRARVAIEYDGEEFHSSPARRSADERRRDALRRAGWIVIVVTKQALSSQARDAWLADLGEALRRRRVVA